MKNPPGSLMNDSFGGAPHTTSEILEGEKTTPFGKCLLPNHLVVLFSFGSEAPEFGVGYFFSRASSMLTCSIGK